MFLRLIHATDLNPLAHKLQLCEVTFDYLSPHRSSPQLHTVLSTMAEALVCHALHLRLQGQEYKLLNQGTLATLMIVTKVFRLTQVADHEAVPESSVGVCMWVWVCTHACV